jgi:integrase
MLTVKRAAVLAACHEETVRRAVTSKEEAKRRWEPLFLGEIGAGRDPRMSPSSASSLQTVSGFLDTYVERYVKAEGLKSEASVISRITALKGHFGARPVRDLERVDVIEDFKVAYGKGRKLSSVNRTLGVLRHAINWGMGRSPALFDKSPFSRFGVKIKTKGETRRDRRVMAEEEQRLLTTAEAMDCGEHLFVGGSMRDRLICALDTGCRRGEMLLILNRHIHWDSYQILIPAEHAKDAETRRIPFRRTGRLAEVLERRRFLGPDAHVFGTPVGEFQGEFRTAWETLLLIASGRKPERLSTHARACREALRHIDLHWHDLRHEAACRWLGAGLDLRAIQLLLGHADLKTTQRYLNVTDAELLALMNQKLWSDDRHQAHRIVSRLSASQPEVGCGGGI